MNNLRQLLCLGVLLFTTVSRLRADAPDPPPKGLNSSDWAGLRAAYDGGRHRIAATASGHQARNPGQHWHTRFDGQGFLVQPDGADWQWGLELTAYGFPGHEHTLPTGSATTLPDVAGSRLDYAWDAGLSEWFVNDARGLEHGFTVHERPADRQVLDCGSPLPLSGAEAFTAPGTSAAPKRQGTGAVQDADAATKALNFHLAIRGDLRPVLEPDGHGVRFVDAHGTTRTTYAGLKVWDADGKTLPAHFESLDAGHPDEITLAVDERGARYPLTIDPIAQQAYLKASNTRSYDLFGSSVAVSGDTAVVGARFAGDEDWCGAVYLFVRSNGTWVQQAYLKPGYPNSRDFFGASVAISGDTVIVGAPQEDGDSTGVNGNEASIEATQSGAAYIFIRSGTNWTQQAYLKASNTGGGIWDLGSDGGGGDRFGCSVAVSGDTVVVGAYGESSKSTGVNGDETDDSAIESGAAYVFVRSGTTWTQQAYLKASNAEPEDRFGYSVAVSGNTVVVGAVGEDSGTTSVNSISDEKAPSSGAAYVFERGGTAWAQQAYLKASHVEQAAWFGYSVAVSGDTVVVGAPNDSSSAAQSGAAYVFSRNGVTWIHQAHLKPSNAQFFDLFGSSVAIAEDTVVIGAESDANNASGVNGIPIDNGALQSGSAYVFARNGEIWAQHAYLKARSIGVQDYFGIAVAISGGTVIVGAVGEDGKTRGINGDQYDNGTIDSGAAYIFRIGGPEVRVEQPIGIGLTDASSNARFGVVSVGGSTDLVFTIRNSGSTNLTDIALTLVGPDANQFSVTANPMASVAPGDSTTFTVRFSPTSDGPKTATLHLASNDPDHNPFDLTLIGTLSVSTVTSSENNLTVSFVGTPGIQYRVQYLPGLTGRWHDFTPPALYTAPANGVFSHTDLNPPDALRLYRSVLEP